MNKKKRALALGLAATQLTALSAIVAPMTAFAEVTKTTSADQFTAKYTVDGTETTMADGSFTIPADSESQTEKTYTVVISAASGYKFAASPSFTVKKKVGESGTDEMVSASFTKDDTSGSYKADLSLAPSASEDTVITIAPADGAILTVITPTIELPEGTTGVSLNDTLETDDTSHQAAIDAAKKLSFKVGSGVTDLTLDAADYEINCEWSAGDSDTPGKVVATLTLSTAGQEKYALSNEDPITVDVPVTYKTPETKVGVALDADGALTKEYKDTDNTTVMGNATLMVATKKEGGFNAPTNADADTKVGEGDKVIVKYVPASGYEINTDGFGSGIGSLTVISEYTEWGFASAQTDGKYLGYTVSASDTNTINLGTVETPFKKTAVTATVTLSNNTNANATISVQYAAKKADDSFETVDDISSGTTTVKNGDVIVISVKPNADYQIKTDPADFTKVTDPSTLSAYGITSPDADTTYYTKTVSGVEADNTSITVNVGTDIVEQIPATKVKATLKTNAKLTVEAVAGSDDSATETAIKTAVVTAWGDATLADYVVLQDNGTSAEIAALAGKFEVETVNNTAVTVSKDDTTYTAKLTLTVKLKADAGNYEFADSANTVEVPVELTVNKAITSLEVTDFTFAVKDGAAQTWTDDGKLSIAFGSFDSINATDVAADLEITGLTGKLNGAGEAKALTDAQLAEVLEKYEISVEKGTGKLTVKVAAKSSVDANWTAASDLAAKDINVVQKITLDYETILATANSKYTVTELTDVLTDKTKGVVDAAITAYLNKDTGAGKDLADIITLTAGTATKGASGYEVTVTAALAAGKDADYVLDDASKTHKHTVTVEKMEVTPAALALNTPINAEVGTLSGTTLTLAKNKKYYTGDNAIDKVVASLVKTPTFTDSESAAVALTADTHYKLTVTKGSDTSVTVALAPVAENELVTFTAPSDLTLTIAYTKEVVAHPTIKSGHGAAYIKLPANADKARVKEAVLEAIDLNGLADMTDYTVNIDKTALESANANDTPNVKVTFTLTDTDNYTFKESGTEKNSIDIDVVVTAEAKLSTLKYEFAAKTVYVDAATKTKVEAALADYKPTFSATDADGNAVNPAPTIADTDYSLVVDYTDGAASATVTIKLSTAKEAEYVLDGTSTSGAVTVNVAIAKLADVTTALEFTTTTADASDQVKDAVKALLTGLAETDYDLTVRTAPVVTAAKDDGTAVVTVTLKNNHVFDLGSDIEVEADRYKTELDVNVAYKVTQAVTKYTVTVTDGTADKPSAAEGELVTVTATIPTGKEIDTVTVTDADEGTVTATKTATGCTFTMPAKNVTVTFTFKDATAATTYTITKATATNGSFTVSPASAAAGTAVTVTATPASGYQLGTIKVTKTGDTATTIKVTGNKFTMPAYPVTVTVTFTKISSGGSSSGGSHSGGSSSGGSHSGGSSVSPSTVVSSADNGSSVSMPSGTPGLLGGTLDDAAKKDLTVSVPVDSTFEWTFKPSEMDNTKDSLFLTVKEASVSTSSVNAIRGTAVTETIGFETTMRELGKSATLTVKTSARPTAAKPQFANLYIINGNGTLTFVKAAPIGADGKATLPMGSAGKYALLVSDETKQMGDLNNDCKVDVNDVVTTINLILNNPASLGRWKGEIVNDNLFNVNDAVALINMILNTPAAK